MPSKSPSEPPPRISVRRATKADAASIASLARGLNEHQHDPTRHFTKAAVLRDGFGRTPKFTVFLAVAKGRAVGYALLVCSYETGIAERGLYLQDLFVREEARGSGAGQLLIAAAAREAERRGGAYLWCTAHTWNREAHRFYRRSGAVELPVMAYTWARRGFAGLARLARGGARKAARRRRRRGTG
ncbi:MAG: GNAT family N-acetyltransferase [Rhodospirillaceae bacterium]|nr:GNAT family N-acetyltransferase [Rhodospirillaceae bacterium]